MATAVEGRREEQFSPDVPSKILPPVSIKDLPEWLLIIVGVTILLTFTEQPLLLLVIGSALSAIVMFIYSILLIVLNRKALPKAIQLGGYRLAILGFAVIWFGYFSVRVIIEFGGQLF